MDLASCGIVGNYNSLKTSRNDLTRNYIRANIMEHAYRINPGLKKVIRKKYLNEKTNEEAKDAEMD